MLRGVRRRPGDDGPLRGLLVRGDAAQAREEGGVAIGEVAEDARRHRQEERGPARDRARLPRAPGVDLLVAEEVAPPEVRAHVEPIVLFDLDLHHPVGDEEELGRRVALPVDVRGSLDAAVDDRVEEHVEVALAEVAREGDRAEEVGRRAAGQRSLEARGDLGLARSRDGAAEDVHRDLRHGAGLDRDRVRPAREADGRLLPERLAGPRRAQLGLPVVAAAHRAQRDLAPRHHEERRALVPRAVHDAPFFHGHEAARVLDLAARAGVEPAEHGGVEGDGGPRVHRSRIVHAPPRRTQPGDIAPPARYDAGPMAQQPPTRSRNPRAAPPAQEPAQRYRTLGTTSLALALLELVWCLQKLVTQLFSRSIFDAQRSLIPQMPNGPSMKVMAEAAHDFAQRIALWEVLRTVPFLVATGFLLWIALRLREGDARALFTARRWTLGAFGAVAVSTLIQIVWILPATAEYQRRIAASMPPIPTGETTPPIDMKEMMGSITTLSLVFGLVLGAAFALSWPIVMRVWAGRLIRETLPADTAPSR